MSNKASPKCPQCGTPIKEDAPAGLCPSCLMVLNLKTETVFTGDSSAEQPPLPPEELAPHFPQLEILECLGRGGMGVVYKARQKSLNRFVALKLLAPERVTDVKFAERFTREAHALAALNHPHIVTVYDFGQAGGYYFLLMEFVDGVNLRQLLQAKKLTPEEALAVIPPLCDALQYAHEHGIVHRDIKPANLLLDKGGRVKIADFGIAKMVGDNSSIGFAESQPAGTPQYMAPEQKDHQRTDHRADIYSLGVVLYEMLTGELPADKLQPPSRKVHIDVRLDEIVLRALEKTPEFRYQTAAEMRTQIETVVSAPEDPRTTDSRAKSGVTPGSHDRPASGSIWLKVLSVLVLWASVPVIGLGLFFLLGMASERGGWHPAPAEAVVVPLTWFGMFLLPFAGTVLWQFARGRSAPGWQSPRALWHAPALAPAACFSFNYLALIILLIATAGVLPENVAMHFSDEGRPDASWPRLAHLLFMALVPGVLTALFVTMARLAMRQPTLLKIPRRDHWLAPEHRAELGGVLLRWMLWLACLETCFFGTLHWLIVRANEMQPPKLSPGLMLVLVFASLSTLSIWLVTFVMRLAKGSSRGECESQTPNAATQPAVTPFRDVQRGDTPAAPAFSRIARVIGVLLLLCFGCIILAIVGWRVSRSKNVEANALRSQALAQRIAAHAAKEETTKLVTATGSLAPVPGSPTKWRISALVAEADIASVKIGQDVSFTLDAFPQGISLGKIAEVGRTPISVRNSVTYETIIDVNEGAAAKSKFKSGMTVSVTFIVEVRSGSPGVGVASKQEEEIILLARERLEQTRQLYQAKHVSLSQVDEAEGELALAEARGDPVKRAEARLTMATKYLERLEDVHRTGNISDAEYNQAKQRKLEAELDLQRARTAATADNQIRTRKSEDWTALDLSYQQFDQTPHSGWRVPAQDKKRFREAAALIEAYLMHDGLDASERVNLHFHAAQCLAFAGDAKSVLDALGHLKQARYAPEPPDAPLRWNDYVSATEAFLKGDLDTLKAARERIAAGPKLNGVPANLDVVDRLIGRFGQPYRQAYSGEPEGAGRTVEAPGK